MDRLDAMRILVAAVDEGSLAAAGRRLRRSPASVSRAIAALEAHVGIQLLHRTTRAIRLSEAGEAYAATCRRVLDELDAAQALAAGERAMPRGILTLTAPVVSGEDILRPVADDFLDAFPQIALRLFFIDRVVNLIDEGMDVALRIAELPDSSMVAIRVGEVRQVIVGAPAYLAAHPPVRYPDDLLAQRLITMGQPGSDSWTFPPAGGGRVSRTLRFTPRLVVNSVRAAIASAVEGHGLTRVLSYQVAEHVRAGHLRLVIPEADPVHLPVNLVLPEGRLTVPKVRAFVDFALPRLRERYAGLALPAGPEPGG